MTRSPLLKPLKNLALGLALASVASLWSVQPLKANPEGQQAVKLMGKAGQPTRNKILSFKKLPDAQSKTVPLDGNSQAQPEAGTDSQRQKNAGIFFNMKREVEVESESWHGSTGLQINW